MDPTLATVIIAIITGIFSVITIKIQKNQDHLIHKIDEQTIFIEKEKAVRQKLVQAEKKRDTIIEKITILSMNIEILLINTISNADETVLNDLRLTSQELQKSYNEALEHIKDISREYDLLISVSHEFQSSLEQIKKKKK